MSIGNKVKKLRELRNYTQEYMADRLGMSLTGYGKIERDEVDIPYKRLEQLSEALGVKTVDILNFDEKVILNFSNNKNINAGYVVHQVISADMQRVYEEQITLLKEMMKMKDDEIVRLKSK